MANWQDPNVEPVSRVTAHGYQQEGQTKLLVTKAITRTSVPLTNELRQMLYFVYPTGKIFL